MEPRSTSVRQIPGDTHAVAVFSCICVEKVWGADSSHSGDLFGCSVRHHFAWAERRRIEFSRLDLQHGLPYRRSFHHGQACVPQILFRMGQRVLGRPTDIEFATGIALTKSVIVGSGNWLARKPSRTSRGAFWIRHGPVPGDAASGHAPQGANLRTTNGEYTRMPDYRRVALLRKAHPGSIQISEKRLARRRSQHSPVHGKHEKHSKTA
jgi:hypothetical protein